MPGRRGLIIKDMGSTIEPAPPLIIWREEIGEGIKIIDVCLTKEEWGIGLK